MLGYGSAFGSFEMSPWHGLLLLDGDFGIRSLVSQYLYKNDIKCNLIYFSVLPMLLHRS